MKHSKLTALHTQMKTLCTTTCIIERKGLWPIIFPQLVTYNSFLAY